MTNLQLQTANRLAKFYQRYAVDLRPHSEVWDAILNVPCNELKHALLSRNSNAIVAAIDRACTNGIMNGVESHIIIEWNSRLGNDFIERLARKTGVLNFHNPEQPSRSGTDRVTDVYETKIAIERVLGFPLAIPDCFGFETGDGYTGVPRRFFHYVEAAYSMSQFLGGFPTTLIEIGAGLGTLGFISKFFPCCNRYTLIDLPQIACLSGWFLVKVFGGDNVWFAGEPVNQLARVKIYPCNDFQAAFEQGYSVVFNSDSFPEMSHQAQDDYLHTIAETIGDGVFFSVNHESDLNVKCSTAKIVLRAGKGLRRIIRSPNVMRDGYVDEIYVRKN